METFIPGWRKWCNIAALKPGKINVPGNYPMQDKRQHQFSECIIIRRTIFNGCISIQPGSVGYKGAG
jgi:hypothetical protein